MKAKNKKLLGCTGWSHRMQWMSWSSKTWLRDTPFTLGKLSLLKCEPHVISSRRSLGHWGSQWTCRGCSRWPWPPSRKHRFKLVPARWWRWRCNISRRGVVNWGRRDIDWSWGRLIDRGRRSIDRGGRVINNRSWRLIYWSRGCIRRGRRCVVSIAALQECPCCLRRADEQAGATHQHHHGYHHLHLHHRHCHRRSLPQLHHRHPRIAQKVPTAWTSRLIVRWWSIYVLLLLMLPTTWDGPCGSEKSGRSLWCGN